MKKLFIYTVLLLSFSPVWAIKMKVTSYCPQESGGYYAKNGDRLKEGDCAADPNIFVFGSYLLINNKKYHFIDIGSAVKGYHIDIYCPNRTSMKRRGTIWAECKIISNKIDSSRIHSTKNELFVQNHRPLKDFSKNTLIFSEFRPYSSKRNYKKLEKTKILICEE